jgi:hypothetical protein
MPQVETAAGRQVTGFALDAQKIMVAGQSAPAIWAISIARVPISKRRRRNLKQKR